MSRISGKIIASAVLLFVLLSIETVERIKASPDLLVLDSNFYIIATFVSTMIYFIILYMYVNHFRNHRRKVAVLSVFLGAIVVILPLRFFLRPHRWDFEFRLIFTIDKSAIAVLLLITYLPDVRMKIISGLFVSLVGLFVVHYTDPHRQPYNAIITGSICTVIFLITFWFYMRVKTERKWKIITFVFFIVVMCGIILTYILCFWYSHWDALFYIVHAADMTLVMTFPLYKNSYELLQSDQDDIILELMELPTRFTYENLLNATKNFQFPIGQGGSSTVYKGILSDCSTVAVKRINGRTSGEDKFKTEITILASLQHINLVHLIGYCLTARGDRYIVYPFFENGSLESWIFSVEEKRRHLTWKMRYQIAIDTAKALSYLHQDCRHQILHLDVKPGNILLDEFFRAKLSDFGISRAMSREDSNLMTKARGTVRSFIISKILNKIIDEFNPIF
jgi:Protein kinase domain